MKHFATLLLIAMVAIATTECFGKYLLVEVDQPEGEANTNEDNSSGRISARGSTIIKLLNLLCFY